VIAKAALKVEQPATPSPRIRIREALAGDYDAIMAVHARNGLAVRSPDEWRHLWSHMAWLGGFEEWPRGWLLEDGRGDVVGTFANIAQEYWWNGRRLVAASASQWAVDAEHRGQAIWLAARFFQQKVDLLLNTTANEAAGKVFAGLKAEQPPARACGEVRFWLTNHARVAEAKMRGLGIPAASLAGRFAGCGLWLADMLKRRRPRIAGIGARVLPEFDARFDDHWQELATQRDLLLAVRDQATLGWRFGNSLRNGATTIIAAETGGKLVGYAVAIRIDDQVRRLRRWRIADLQAAGSRRAETWLRLILAAIEFAKQRQVDTVEIVGQSAEKLAALARLSPRRRTYSVCPFFYKAANRELAEALRRESAWDPALIDGDASMF
jgi:hypothetical protein